MSSTVEAGETDVPTTAEVPDLKGSRLGLHMKTAGADIRAFVEERLERPARIGDAWIWSFSEYPFKGLDLLEKSADLIEAPYVIPHETATVWAYIVDLLPPALHDAYRLIWSAGRSEYLIVQNYRRKIGEATVREKREEYRETVTEVIRQEVGHRE